MNIAISKLVTKILVINTNEIVSRQAKIRLIDGWDEFFSDWMNSVSAYNGRQTKSKMISNILAFNPFCFNNAKRNYIENKIKYK